jgi:hypothetical protein
VLTALNEPQILFVANRFRPQRELHRLIHEQLVSAVEDCYRGNMSSSQCRIALRVYGLLHMTRCKSRILPAQ